MKYSAGDLALKPPSYVFRILVVRNDDVLLPSLREDDQPIDKGMLKAYTDEG